jgi:hypothetical protein
MSEALIEAINHLEDVLVAYFADKEIPMALREAVDAVELAIAEEDAK